MEKKERKKRQRYKQRRRNIGKTRGQKVKYQIV